MTEAEIESEIERCQHEIHQLLNKIASFTMAYPNGSGQDNEAKDMMVRNILKKYFIGARATQINSSRINEYLWEEPFTNESYFRVNSAMITDDFSVSNFVNDLERPFQQAVGTAPRIMVLKAAGLLQAKPFLLRTWMN